VADDADALAAEAAEAADDRRVLAVFAIAGQRDEIGDEPGDVVEAVRPLRMAGDLGLLPGCQLGVEFLERLRRLAFDAGDLLVDGNRVALGLERAQLSILASSSATGFSKSR
jgi:hypothetical protein